MIKNLRNHQGFTLIEILVSIALIGMVAVTILGLFSASLRNNNASKVVIENAVTAKDIMENLKEKLSSIPEGSRDMSTINNKIQEVKNLYSGSSIIANSKTEVNGLYILEVEVEDSREGKVERFVSQIYLP